MLLSTSTNLVAFRPDGGKNPMAYCIKTCARGGYKVLDINFCEAMNPYSRLRDEDWESYIKELGHIGKEEGVTFTQSHLPYYDVFANKDEKKAEELEKLIRRSIIASGMLGVKWAVTHPCTVYGVADSNITLERNVDYYGPHVALAKEYGVGIALENEFEYMPRQPRQRIFCSDVQELRNLVDAFDATNVGACYDFGHGHLVGGFHRENLNILGKRLKAVHVQDNLGDRDGHDLPFCGNINWAEAMAGLADIGYEGELTYEIQEFSHFFPNELKPLVVDISIKVGQYLISLYNKALEEKYPQK